MLKKSALSLFGLVVMLICFNPAQAHAGVVVSIGPVYPRPVYVRPYAYVAPVPYVAYRPAPYFYGPTYVRPGWVSEMKKMHKLGVHIFYRPRAWGDGGDAPEWSDPETTQTVSKAL